MLKSLKISGFKSIFEETLNFGRINLFVGPNGAGKSNALEALAVLSAALARGLDPISLDSKGVRLSLPHLFKSAFRNTDLKPHFRLEAQFEHGRYECSIRSNAKKSILEFHSEALYQGEDKIYGRGPNGIKIDSRFVEIPSRSLAEIEGSRSVWDAVRLFADVSDSFRAEIEQIANFRIYAPQTAIMRGMAVDNRPVEPLGLTGSGLASAFNEYLKSVVELDKNQRRNRNAIMSLIWKPGWADHIRIGGFDPTIVPSHVVSEGLQLYIRDKYMKTNRNFLSTFDASEGTLYLIFVTTLLLHRDTPKTFGLDNVDGTLNPALVRELTKIMVQACTGGGLDGAANAYQAFMTSHHPSSLDSFDIFREDQRIFVASRKKEGVAVGSTSLDRLEPPAGVDREQWVDYTGGRKLSVFLLEEKIPGALT